MILIFPFHVYGISYHFFNDFQVFAHLFTIYCTFLHNFECCSDFKKNPNPKISTHPSLSVALLGLSITLRMKFKFFTLA